MSTRKQQTLIGGAGTHRRTEADYVGAMLEAVTLDDWREVVREALTMAKGGDAQARAWLAQYLMGRPEAKAPAPLAVVVNQWAGRDPVADKLAHPMIERQRYPSLHQHDDLHDDMRARVAAELREKLQAVEAVESPATARLPDQSDG